MGPLGAGLQPLMPRRGSHAAVSVTRAQRTIAAEDAVFALALAPRILTQHAFDAAGELVRGHLRAVRRVPAHPCTRLAIADLRAERADSVASLARLRDGGHRRWAYLTPAIPAFGGAFAIELFGCFGIRARHADQVARGLLGRCSGWTVRGVPTCPYGCVLGTQTHRPAVGTFATASRACSAGCGLARGTGEACAPAAPFAAFTAALVRAVVAGLRD